VSFGDAFVFRSADMRWRVRVHARRGAAIRTLPRRASGRWHASTRGSSRSTLQTQVHPHTDDRQPYKVSFYNLMTEETGEDVELKHHDEGYLWIERGHAVTHSAGLGHTFELRDVEKRSRVSLELHLPDEDEI
jgi:hypothetical protein